MTKPEELARLKIDELLEAAGWQVQDYSSINLTAALQAIRAALSYAILLVSWVATMLILLSATTGAWRISVRSQTAH